MSPSAAGLHWVRPPQQARSQETLNRLLDAAEQLVAEKGFDDTPVAEVARRAGSSVGAFYSRFREKTKAWVNLIGCGIFLFPVTGVIFWMAWPYVAASWETLEGSVESSGLQAVYLLKSMILFFAATLFLQGISLMLHSVLSDANASSARPRRSRR